MREGSQPCRSKASARPSVYNRGMSVQAPSRTATVTLGIERLLTSERSLVRGRRVGLLCNPASIDGGFRHSADVLVADPDVELAAIFGPQHGFRADLQDNMIETPHASDARRRVPVYSLYSEVREPSAEMLRDLDALVIDIQDVGTRVYTFIYTMANCMRAAARHGVPVIVCDRPNPVNGADVGGGSARAVLRVVRRPVSDPHAPRHDGRRARAALQRCLRHRRATSTWCRMEGWRRGMFYDDTSLPWVMPSPNMPTLESAIVYPGAVLFEGTLLSEGRGTTRPFELIGAPWIDGEHLAEAMNARGLPGIHFRPAFFEPTFQKHARQSCGGCQLHVTDRGAFRAAADGGRTDRRVRAAGPGALRLAPAPLRVRAREDADRHPLRLGSAAHRDRWRG